MIRNLLIALSLATATATADDDLDVLSAMPDGSKPSQMMHARLMDRMHQALDRRRDEYEKLKAPEQLAEHQRRTRQFFVDAVGGFPQRTPLRPQIVGKEDRDGYRIEKIIYESRPKHFVTAILYLPTTVPPAARDAVPPAARDAVPPYPAVLVPCGHSNNGKASETYQRVSILLARNGMAALCYDPIEQGERYQLLDTNGKPRAGGTTAHCLVGTGSTLLGRNTAGYRIWDGMRGIDYLQSRPEIDPKRIGCTGNSGGGTLTSYLMALDERIVCAAPSCYLTTMRRLCETIGPQDAEQNIFGQIGFGMDHPDYVMMRAPKPTLLCCATHDFFDITGTWDNFRQAKRFYTRMGFAERVDLIELDAKHGFSTELRVGTVRWMRRWLMDTDDAITEPESPIATDEQLQCTPRGQVMLLDGARSTYDINNDLEAQYAKARKKFWQETDKARALAEVRRITGIRKLSDLPKPECKIVAARETSHGYTVEKLILAPEPGIRLPALAYVPKNRSGEAYLCLDGQGKRIAVHPDGPVERLAKQGHVVLAVDLRGLGETAGGESPQRGIPLHVGSDWKDLYLAYLLGTSYLAMRTEDVAVCARFLAGYQAGEKPNRVHVTSSGRVGPAVLHAAALEPQLFASVEIHGSLNCWSDVVREPMSVGQFENVVHGALKTYDLPDLLNTLPKDKITFGSPRGALGQPLWK
ncbi:MAG: prolyl oligopeptidase family serine peptidase [Candidatus Nealsonbacteria bacterium]|nr:prolyl oligopeptidase family serine peptidase [Candidatus Nealsonbacteria bacterium]